MKKGVMRVVPLMLAALAAILMVVPVSAASASTVSGKITTQPVSAISSARSGVHSVEGYYTCFPPCNEFWDGAQCISKNTGYVYTCSLVEGLWIWVQTGPDVITSRSYAAKLSH